MAMTATLEKAFLQASNLPEETQRYVAEMVFGFVKGDATEEAEWDALTQSPESQSFLDQMAEKVRNQRESGEIIDSDPADV